MIEFAVPCASPSVSSVLSDDNADADADAHTDADGRARKGASTGARDGTGTGRRAGNGAGGGSTKGALGSTIYSSSSYSSLSPRLAAKPKATWDPAAAFSALNQSKSSPSLSCAGMHARGQGGAVIKPTVWQCHYILDVHISHEMGMLSLLKTDKVHARSGTRGQLELERMSTWDTCGLKDIPEEPEDDTEEPSSTAGDDPDLDLDPAFQARLSEFLHAAQISPLHIHRLCLSGDNITLHARHVLLQVSRCVPIVWSFWSFWSGAGGSQAAADLFALSPHVPRPHGTCV